MTRPVEALAGAAVLLCAAGGAAVAVRAAARATATAARATGRGIASGAARAWRPVARVVRGRDARQIASLQGIQADQAAALASLAAALMEQLARQNGQAAPAPATRPPQWVLDAVCHTVAAPAPVKPRAKDKPAAAVAQHVTTLGPEALSALILGLERRVVS